MARGVLTGPGMTPATTPLEGPRERRTLPFDRARFARDALDATVGYLGVVRSPRGTSRTRRRSDGSLELRTELRGRVVPTGPTGLAVEHGALSVAIRHLLPEAIDLGALVGETIGLELVETLRHGRCTVDARVFDAAGGLVLWARDGALPEDRAAHGLAMRLTVAESGHGLAISHRAGLAVVRGPGTAMIESCEGAMLVLVLRAGDDDAAFVALRR